MKTTNHSMVNVLCMKWGTLYPPDYVNRLYSMVARNLSLPFRFVCFTDDPDGIRPEVETRPIPAIDLPVPPGRWLKQRVFVSPLHDLQGTALFLDLDIVIVAPIDAFFSVPGEFLIIEDWKRKGRHIGNSSVFRFEIGQHSDLLDEFRQQADAITRRFVNEQEYLTDFMYRKGVLHYWPEGWCVSYKHHCLPPFPYNLFRNPVIPQGSKIIVFHGHPKPHEALLGKPKNLFKQMRPARWIADHWR